jgi:3-oxoacid CoA-transferase subunit A
MIYITGDTHGDFRRIAYFCATHGTTENDILIILGDAGINYFEDHRDVNLKTQLKDLQITLFCLHGNHEARPDSTGFYRETAWNGGVVFAEDRYPNILFPRDGEIFDFNGVSAIVIGGAYSVDKYYRLERNWRWWSNEQPDERTKTYVEKQLEKHGNKIDVVLSHTCPLKYKPVEVFLSGIDQSTVDKSTEIWLGAIESRLAYKKWYCGHYHTVKKIDNLEFMFDNVKQFTTQAG